MDRRRALVLFVNSVVASIGGGLAALLGLFTFRSPAAAERRWVSAGAVYELTPNLPAQRVIGITRHDGCYRHQSRATVFLVWDGDQTVKAFSGTCTHLGCQVRWDAESSRFRCPCHGGVFDAEGRVIEGPPPRPLDRLEARVESTDQTVLVRL